MLIPANENSMFPSGSRAPKGSSWKVNLRARSFPKEVAPSMDRGQAATDSSQAGARKHQEVWAETAFGRPARAQEHKGQDPGPGHWCPGEDPIRRDQGCPWNQEILQMPG